MKGRSFYKLFLSFIIILPLSLVSAGCTVKASAEEKYEESRANLMNTFFKVTVFSDYKESRLCPHG
jgi:hypothetical protein